MSLRKCRVCGIEAINDDELKLFKKHKGMKHDHDTICNKCSRLNLKNWKKNNPQLVQESKKRRREKGPTDDCLKRERILNKIEKPYRCYFCGQIIEERPVPLHSIDHNHDNWSLENKTPVHTICHGKRHRQEQIETPP